MVAVEDDVMGGEAVKSGEAEVDWVGARHRGTLILREGGRRFSFTGESNCMALSLFSLCCRLSNGCTWSIFLFLGMISATGVLTVVGSNGIGGLGLRYSRRSRGETATRWGPMGARALGQVKMSDRFFGGNFLMAMASFRNLDSVEFI